MSIKSILDAKDLSGKRVLVRVDWNVPIKNGIVLDDLRIKRSLVTVEYLRKARAKIILATHLEPEELSTEVLGEFVPSGVELLENLRKNAGEKNNSEEFAKDLASRADIFVNEAFSASHRSHASIVGVPKLLPSYAGIEFMEEVGVLSRVFSPDHPFLFVQGGAKFETKLPLLKKFINKADTVFVGGALANNFLKARGVDIGDSLVSDIDFGVEDIINSGKIMLPTDTRVESNRIVDAGPKTLDDLKVKIAEAKMILWNGPLGQYENGFKEGTLGLAQLLAQANGETIVGGADTLAAIKELNLFDRYDFVSSGGGAMLHYLANETLPGIDALTE